MTAAGAPPLTEAISQASSAAGRAARVESPDGPWLAYATLLCADAMASMTAGADAVPADRWSRDGALGAAARLALACHRGDRDDLHWRAGVHPGSVVWPAILALAEGGADPADVRAAAAAGYAAIIATAGLLGPRHARHWHLTATAGTVGAAAAAAVLTGAGEEELGAAVAHALAIAGGVGQVVIDRTDGAAVNRAGAVLSGILAARAAAAGLTPSGAVLDGPRGLLRATGAHSEGDPLPSIPPPAGPGALRETSVRLYPVTGFLQSAVAGIRRLRPPELRELPRIVFTCAPAVAAMTGERGVRDAWWEARRCLAAAWLVGEVWQLDRRAAQLDGPLAALIARVEVRTDDLPAWSAIVQVDHAGSSAEAVVDTPPGWDAELSRAELHRKWASMGTDPATLLGRAADLLS